MTPQMTHHKVGPLSVRLLNEGKGAPVLFLHGSGGHPGWPPFLQRLAATHEVIVPEHPGFGASDEAPQLRSVADMAFYYLDFMETLGREKLHIIGHSLGGWIAAEVAIRDCSRFSSLTLIAPAGLRVRGIPSGDNFIWSPEETASNLFTDPALVEQWLAHTPTPEEADALLRNRLMAAKLGWEPRWFNPALEHWLHRIRVKTLLLWGEDDKLLPAAYAKAWTERLPDCHFTAIPRCGHLPQVEAVDQVLKSFAAFL